VAGVSILAQVSAGALMLHAGLTSPWPRLVPHDAAVAVAAASFELFPASYRHAHGRPAVHGIRASARVHSRLAAHGLGLSAPSGAEPSTSAVVHVRVRPGDTVMALAARYGTSEAAIIRANRLRHPTALALGMPVIIPTNESAEPGAVQQPTGENLTASTVAAAPTIESLANAAASRAVSVERAAGTVALARPISYAALPRAPMEPPRRCYRGKWRATDAHLGSGDHRGIHLKRIGSGSASSGAPNQPEHRRRDASRPQGRRP